jgi:hypothetical protein
LSPTTAVPSFAPSFSPTVAGFINPTAAPTSLILVQAQQAVTVTTLPATAAEIALFKSNFISSILTVLNAGTGPGTTLKLKFPDGSIVIINFSTTPARRNVRTLLAAGSVNIQYTVTVKSATQNAAAVTTQLKDPATTTALSTSLVAKGVAGASAAQPTVTDLSPSSMPTMAPTFSPSDATAKNSGASFKSSTMLVMIASASLLVFWGL